MAELTAVGISRICPVKRTLLLVGICMLCVTVWGDDDDDHWCHDHDNNIDPFQEVKTYMNITTDGVNLNDLDRIIDFVFWRVKCDEQTLDPSVTCQTCLNASNIYQVLTQDPAAELDETTFQKSCTILLTFLYQLPSKCNEMPTTDWSTLTYEHFTDELLVYHPPHAALSAEEERFFTLHQLEGVLHAVNESYRTEEYGSASNVSKSFRSRDVLVNTDMHHPEEGAEEEELGDLASNVIARILQGYYIKADRLDTDGLPDEDDFLAALFRHYGENDTCTIGHEGFSSLLHDIAVEGDDGEHDHEPHGHLSGLKLNQETQKHVLHSRRSKRDDHDHDHDHGSSFIPNPEELCLTDHAILETFYMESHDVSISREDFLRMCPALIQQSAQGCQHDPHIDHIEPSNAEKYGYGTLAVLIISASAALGLVIVKSRSTPVYVYVMSVMLGLSFGTLVGDALLHLVPHGLGLHDHSHDGHNHAEDEGIVIEPFVWKMLCSCGTVWVFFMLQMVLQSVTGGHSHSQVGHGDLDMTRKEPVNESSKHNGIENLAYTSHEDGTVENGNIVPDKSVKSYSLQSGGNISTSSGSEEEIRRAESSVGWMVSVGDGVHNLADGLAVGAAFAMGWRSGISTSLAVFCHELPHEFGDVGILLSCGWSLKKIAIFQMVSAFTAFIGLYIGIPVSSNEEAREWIFIVAAGMFVYIALSDVVPELLEMFQSAKHPWRVFAAIHGGALLGFGLMLIIAIFEEQISI